MTTLRFWELIHLETAGCSAHQFPQPHAFLCASLPAGCFWVLSFNTLMHVRKVTSSVQWASLVNYQTLARACGNPRLEVVDQRYKWQPGPCNLCVKRASLVGLSPYPLGSALTGATRMVPVVKNPPADAGDACVKGLIPRSGRCWRRAWKSTPVFLPGESYGRRSLVSYSPWGRRVRNDWSTLGRMHDMPKHRRYGTWELRPGVAASSESLLEMHNLRPPPSDLLLQMQPFTRILR